ncbi:hypothetical protein BUE80_DR004308 [Diplocarpon rosae]|nr:hypothetical protein BUE80_DR004308 [Diplocarpon rosae]
MPQDLNSEGADYHSDTIIVKSENNWPSPDNSSGMSSPGIYVTSLLAQIANTGTPRTLESPGPERFEDELPPHQNRTENLNPRLEPRTGPKPKQRKHILVTNTMEERLMAMPQRRELPWRAGTEPGADNEQGGESRRKQIRFGCLLATRGEVQETPCNSCANGRGKFNVCVALDGYFKGACASCQLSGRPNRCSIKKNEVGDITGSPSLNPPAEELVPSRDDTQHAFPSDPRDAKRRKTDMIPAWESARPSWEQELGESHARQQMNDIVQRPWATVNSSTTMANSRMINGLHGTSSRPPMEGHGALGWSVSQQGSLTGGQVFSNGGEGSGSTFRPALEQGRREETVGNEDGSLAIIDTLSKGKQRQVYGLMSGLQGGILTLQRELDALKRALGIDDEG